MEQSRARAAEGGEEYGCAECTGDCCTQESGKEIQGTCIGIALAATTPSSAGPFVPKEKSTERGMDELRCRINLVPDCAGGIGGVGRN